MSMRFGERYRCQNPGCRCEVEVTRASMEATTNPKCCCGAEMKKPYEKPVFEVLDAKPALFPEVQERKK